MVIWSQSELERIWQEAQTLLDADQPSRAEPLLENLVLAVPKNAVVQCQLGICRFSLNKFEQAKSCFETAIALEPDEPLSYTLLAQTDVACGDARSAIEALSALLQKWPDDRNACFYLSDLYTELREFGLAIDTLSDFAERSPADLDVLYKLIEHLRLAARFEEALNTVRELEQRQSASTAGVAAIRGDILQQIGDIESAQAQYKMALELEPHSSTHQKRYLFNLLNLPGIDSDRLLEEHLTVHKSINSVAGKEFSAQDRDWNPDRRLKIGYVSSDFRMHVVAFNILPLIENHNNNDFEIFLFNAGQSSDQITERFKKAAHHWVELGDQQDAFAASEIRSRDIDIVVFLAGRFDGNRNNIASFRCAPVQVAFHDCATSGLKEMDYWLTDAYLHPDGSSEKSTETLQRLPVYYQFSQLDPLPDISTPPAVSSEDQCVTFGVFNKPEKINGEVADTWSEILQRTPNSRLLLKYFNYYESGLVRERLRSLFEHRGVSEDRIEFAAGYDPRGTHFDTFKRADIMLDPFPFNGATTTFEALSMGMPVVALWGERFVSRVAGSLLSHIDMERLAAQTPQEYVEIAVQLASDINQIAALRQEIRARLLDSDLLNGPRYATQVEDAFRQMWTHKSNEMSK